MVDATQGVEAQTDANVHLAMKQGLTIIPVINKIDLPHANVPQTKTQLEDILAIPGDSAILASAKEGIGIHEILEAIVQRIPAPKPTGERSLQALSFDSYFDVYQGVVTLVRVFNGELKAGISVKLLHSGKSVEVKEVGSFNPKPYRRERLGTGETGYIANIKSPKDVKIGNTLTDAKLPSPALPVFQSMSYTIDYYRARFKGTLIANSGFDRDSANTAIESKQADLISFAKPFIGSPDLVRRFREDLPLATSSPETYYQGGAQGYVDYPTAST